MTTNITFLLIGNTRLHWAQKIGENYQYSHSLINKPIPEKINISNSESSITILIYDWKI